MTTKNLQEAARTAARELLPIMGTIFLSKGSDLWQILENMEYAQRESAVMCIDAAEHLSSEQAMLMLTAPLLFGEAVVGSYFDRIVSDARARITPDMFQEYLANMSLVKAAHAENTGEGDPDPFSVAKSEMDRFSSYAESATSDPQGTVAESGFRAETDPALNIASPEKREAMAEWERYLLDGKLPTVADVRSNDSFLDPPYAEPLERLDGDGVFPQVGSPEWQSREDDATARATLAEGSTVSLGQPVENALTRFLRKHLPILLTDEERNPRAAGTELRSGDNFGQSFADQNREYVAEHADEASDAQLSEALRDEIVAATGLPRERVRVVFAKTEADGSVDVPELLRKAGLA